MNATIFAHGFYLHNDKCYYVDDYHTLWRIQPTYAPEGTPFVITKIRIFDRSQGHPPYEHEVKSEIQYHG